MIHFLKGIIEEVGEDYLAIDVNGVGYLVFCSSRMLAGVATGEVLKIHIHTHVREDQFTLFGFATAEDRAVFDMLLKVNGVGAKMGLSILSALSCAEILDAILRQDSKAFTVANGVGKKLAERIIMELKSKTGTMPAALGAGVETGATPQTSEAQDVISALMNLGYKQPDAQSALARVTKMQPDATGFDTLFKASLQELR